MRTRTAFLVVAALSTAFAFNPNLQAQPLVTIDTVVVGDAGNAPDTRTNAGSFGYGAVLNVFAIGKYEVTISQYTTFLNSVAAVTSDSYIVNLWNTNMASDLNIAGISRSGSGVVNDAYTYSVVGPSGQQKPPEASSPGNRPISYVSWFDAARFANWVHNGATNGSSTETGAYTLNGATSGVGFTKNADATWWIPSEDEWFKAAYYKGGGTNAGYWLFPTESDAMPGNALSWQTNQANYQVGESYAVTGMQRRDDSQNYLTDVGAYSNSASGYGTFDQGGNVWEWNDAVNGSSRGVRGGRWVGGFDALQSTFRSEDIPTNEYDTVGFRLASVPEPSTYALLLMTGAGVLWWARRRR